MTNNQTLTPNLSSNDPITSQTPSLAASLLANNTASPPPPELAVYAAYIFSVLELVVHAVVFWIAIFNALVLVQSTFLHWNLRAILLVQSATIASMEVTRFLLVLIKICSGDIFIK